MALVIYWYDIVCFGIVAASFVVSLGVLWRRDLASKCDDNFLYQSLLVARPDINDQTVLAMPRNHVGSSQLWTSCWKGVHPGWLLATRFISFLVMAGLLWRDIVDWDATIFMYYTDLVFSFLISSGQLSRQEPLWFGSRIHPCLILQKDFGTGSDGKSQKQGQSRCIFMISGSHAGDIFLFSLLVSHALSGSLLRWCFCLLFLHSFLILKLLYGNVNVIVNWFLILVSNLSAQMDIYVDYDIFRDMSNILGTVMSAYGCWVSLKQPAVSEHGENSVFLKRDVEEDGTTTSTTYKEKKSGGTIKLRSHCAEEAIRERAGFWGYLMQIIYQVSHQDLLVSYVCMSFIYIHVGISAFFPCNNSSALNAFIYTQTSFYRRHCDAKFTKIKKLLAVAHSSVNPLEYTIMKPKCVHIMGLQAFQ
ncbi:hypothetical protein NC652_007025 [Populus alba x Populus x berolinensis]|nr:hypothetical protein NC652_007025 [Populus alba x Populus x berolinensis]